MIIFDRQPGLDSGSQLWGSMITWVLAFYKYILKMPKNPNLLEYPKDSIHKRFEMSLDFGPIFKTLRHEVRHPWGLGSVGADLDYIFHLHMI